MDDERWEPGMPVLDRQGVPGEAADAVHAVTAGSMTAGSVSAGSMSAPVRPLGPARRVDQTLPPSLQGLPQRSVPETAPTPLQKHFVLLSAPALVLGAIAITALELGAGFESLLVKLCILVAAPLLLLTTADATLRIWRSAWAWMPVDRGRGLFRIAWVLVSLVFLALIVVAVLLVLGA
ncbi:MAG: hypothetical protein ABIR11_02995 [Candidatus Limnocylindrales bacterium]